MNQYVYGHRGASGYAPENTLEAFDLAAKMGAYGVELDVQLTRDGELVVAHDEWLERVSDGSGFLKDHTLKELKSLHFNKTSPEFENARIPTLREVFELLMPTGLHVNAELKNSIFDYPKLEQKVLELAAECGMQNRIIYSSFNHHSMLRMKQLDPSASCGLLYEGVLVRPWEYAKALGMDALHPQFCEPLMNAGECSEAHRLGLTVNTWTVNGELELGMVIASGVDGIITNYPDRALRLLEQR